MPSLEGSDRTKLAQGIEHRPSMSDRSNQGAAADVGTMEKLLWPLVRAKRQGCKETLKK